MSATDDATDREPTGLEGRRVAIIGMAESGRAAARLALGEGARVYASDVGADPRLRRVAAELEELGGDAEVGGHDVARIAGSEIVVVSPGIPPDAPVLGELRERGVRWISELEFADRLLGAPLIAVTGTNGKTTTAALAAHLLREDGRDAVLAGNVGSTLGPALSEVALRARREEAPEWVVAETSSFQLRDTVRFSPEVGVVTNLAPDHLDVYETVDDYHADKAKLFRNATGASRWVLNAGDPAVLRLAAEAPGRRFLFGDAGEVGDAPDAAFVDGETLVLRREGAEEPLCAVGELRLMGAHNVENALAAALAASAAGAGASGIGDALPGFRPLPHRLEPVAEIDGVLWIDDSKATNVASARVGIRSVRRPAVVLLGGKDKGEPYAPLRPALAEGARAVVAYGAAGERIEDEVAGEVPVVRVDGSFEDAVAAARRLARPGDAVLLSPACSSYDMFSSYEERGRRFAELVREGR